MPSLESHAPNRTHWVFYLIIGIIVTFIVFSLVRSFLPPPPAVKVAVSPFKPMDGKWEGTLVTYDHRGQVVAEYRVSHNVKHVQAKRKFRQEVFSEFEKIGTGKVTERQSIQLAELDGSALNRQVVNPDERRVDLQEGVRRAEGFVWFRDDDDAFESEYHWIEKDIYHIEGLRIAWTPQGDVTHWSIGRFARRP